MSLPTRIAPSILACDFARLGQEMARAEAAGADWHHVDVMDGHRVPNLSIGLPVVEAAKEVSRLPLDVHLMIEQPGEWAQRYADAGADILTFHIEACPDSLGATIERFRQTGCRVGVAVDGLSSPEPLRPFLDAIDMVLIMSVQAGFGGQKFMEEALPKIRQVRDWGFRGDLQVDGGITDRTIGLCSEAGANVFVAGTYLYAAESMADALTTLRQGAATAPHADNGAEGR